MKPNNQYAIESIAKTVIIHANLALEIEKNHMSPDCKFDSELKEKEHYFHVKTFVQLENFVSRSPDIYLYYRAIRKTFENPDKYNIAWSYDGDGGFALCENNSNDPIKWFRSEINAKIFAQQHGISFIEHS